MSWWSAVITRYRRGTCWKYSSPTRPCRRSPTRPRHRRKTGGPGWTRLSAARKSPRPARKPHRHRALPFCNIWELDGDPQLTTDRYRGDVDTTGSNGARPRVRMTGSLGQVRAGAPGAPPMLSAELAGDRDAVTVIWLGRNRITGIEPGRALSVE